MKDFERPAAGEFDPRPPLGRRAALALGLSIALAVASCMPETKVEQGDQHLTIYGFSVLKDAMEKSIIPGFQAKWKKEHGQTLQVTSSFAGSETITNQILQGVDADIAIVSIERDAERLRDGKAVTSDWHKLPRNGVVNQTPFVILVRKGNPKGIHDFPDLAKPGVEVIHPDPFSSGGAQWSLLALYGSELIKSEKLSGKRDAAAAEAMLKAIWKNVIATPDSARGARTLFETGHGDTLVTYELEGLQLLNAGAPFEVIVPKATIFSEHVACLVDRNVTPEQRPAAEAFLQYLWSEEAQRMWVEHHFHSVTDESLNEKNPVFAKIELPFTVAQLGGWARAYPDIIEAVWRDRIQTAK